MANPRTPITAGPLCYPPGVTMGGLTAAVLASCLAQVTGNAREVAAGGTDDEHVHQLRIGLRRLRTALRELPALAPDRETLEPTLAAVFAALGVRRDQDHVLRQVLPRIQAAGAPPIAPLPPPPHAVTPALLVQDAAFQHALLDLQAREVQLRAEGGTHVRRRLRAPLAALLRQVLRDGHRFKALDAPAQHRVRKRVKRLRYLAEFAAPLFPARRVGPFVAALQTAQDALGRYNDERVAQTLYAPVAADGDPGARFAVDWLQARSARRAGQCQKLLRRLAQARPFWSA